MTKWDLYRYEKLIHQLMSSIAKEEIVYYRLMEKTFDRLQHSFMMKVFSRLGIKRTYYNL